jgi:L-glyceraldehyde 3-phosphate reductase
MRMDYLPAEDRYASMPYRRSGRSGLKLPAISLGLWHNFGHDRSSDTQRAIVRRAFDRGVTHFDLANNYGPPAGSAEENFGRLLATDLKPYRDELVISTKAGYDMWPGPYGEWGSRKYLLSSLDQSLQRMGLDYVDIFYSHRFDPDTPLQETMGALDSAVRQGKALYVGISSYSGHRTEEAAQILRDLGTPLLIHQPSYSLLNRWVEEDLLDVLEREGIGSIAFSPLAQGMLTDKYLGGSVPADSRAAQDHFLKRDMLTPETLAHVEALNAMAADRGQSLAQMAIAWTLRDPRVTSSLIGASSVQQLDENLAALDNLEFTDDELATIDQHAVGGRRHQPLVVLQRALKWYGGPYLRSGATSVVSRPGAREDPPMQSHAEHIQAILARELETQRREIALVQPSLLTVPPRSSGIAAAGARAQASR